MKVLHLLAGLKFSGAEIMYVAGADHYHNVYPSKWHTLYDRFRPTNYFSLGNSIE